MRRSFVLFLCIVLIISFVGCGGAGHKEDDITTEVAPTIEVEITEALDLEIPSEDSDDEHMNSEEEQVEETEPQVGAPEFEYYMAPIYKAPMDENGWTKIWFVVEFKTLGYHVSYTNPFIITNMETDQVLTDGIFNETSKRTVHVGKVCSEIHTDDFFSNTGLDYEQYPICIDYYGDIDFEDLHVVCNLQYDDNANGIHVGTEETTLEFNADVSQITTYQEYIHGGTLFEIDGCYYVNESDGGVAGDLYESYSSFDIQCVNGTMGQLVSSLEDKVEYVYAPVRRKADAEDVAGYESLQSINVPDNCIACIDGDSSMYIGLKSADGHVLTDEECAVSYLMNIRYIFDDGRTMTLIGF